MPKQKLRQIVVRSYDEAYKIGKPYIKKQTRPHTAPGGFTMPTQVGEPVWEMSAKALENTLKYVCEYLHHQSYMLCIENNDILLCKLEMGTTAPVFSEIIEEQLWDVNTNPTMTQKQIKFVQDSVEKNIDKLRVMQCVVKPYGKDKDKDDDQEASNNEYLELLKGLDLPNGVFLLNLTDALILRNDGKAPFTMVTGKVDMGKYNFDKHIPILSMSGQRNYLDIPIPNYDDIANFYKTNPKMKTKWADKKITKAVFRGGPTGCGYTERTNMRIKLAMMESPLLDVELTGKGTTIDSNSIRFDPKYGLGMLNTGIKSSKSFLTMADQSNYKYIIHVDGNVNAYRLLTTMATGSLILRVTSQYKSWVDHLLKHMEHYVPVKADLSDLLGVVQWCKKHDAECQKIAQAGAEFARKVLNEVYIKGYFKQLLWTVSGMDQVTMPKLKAKAPKALAQQGTIAVITIFRDNDEGKREIQRRTFIERMNATLEPYKYHVFIIEQSQDGNPFNIGKLKNVGFDIVKDYERKHKGTKFTNFIFTDIDMLPDDDLLPYYVNPIDGILSLAVRGTRYEQMDTQTKKVFLGGVLGFNRESFEQINGYPNNFWGWGGEDDALIYRLVAANVSTVHMPKSGKVIDLEDKMTVQEKLKKTVIDDKKWEKLFIDTTNWRTNGMSTLEYKLLATTKENANTTQYKVDLLKDQDEKAHPELYQTMGLKFKWDNRNDRKKITDEYTKLGLDVLEVSPMELVPQKKKATTRKEKVDTESGDDEYVTFPENKKRCPTGYSSTMKNGIKVCKKNKTKKKQDK